MVHVVPIETRDTGQAAAESPLAARLAAVSARLGRRPRVLLVEDEALIALDMSMTLREAGVHVLAVAGTGAAALQAVKDQLPDLVLMDISLRGLVDGVDTVRLLRERHPSLPVVYVTGQADETTRRRAEETNPLGYLIKPVEGRILIAAVFDALDRPHA